MGENAEMILDGECCQLCGEYLGKGVGYSATCDSCYSEEMKRELEKEFEQK